MNLSSNVLLVKKGLKLEKKEGDNCTPIGVFKIGKVYYRPDRVEKLDTILKTKKITKIWVGATIHIIKITIKKLS